MLKQITMMESGTIRGLLISMVGIVGLVLSLFGVDAAVFGQEANKFIDALMSLLATGGAAYAAYARSMNPTPPLTDTATQKTRELQAKQGGFATTWLMTTVAVVGLALLTLFALTGCATGERAEGFADSAAVTELQLNSLIVATTNSLKAGAITANEAKSMRELATSASDTLGLAEEAYAAGDLSTAMSRYKLARGVLRELQARLNVEPTRSNP